MTELSDLISRKRIRYELGESNMPKRYRDFCLRVIDSERLTPTVEIKQFKPKEPEEYTGKYKGREFYIRTCPTCGTHLDVSQVQKYCHECGQRLEWKNESVDIKLRRKPGKL